MENSWGNTFRLHMWCHQGLGSVSWNSLSSGFWGVISVLSTASSNRVGHKLLGSSLGRECISLNSKWKFLTSLWSGQFTSGTHPLTHERRRRQEGGIPLVSQLSLKWGYIQLLSNSCCSTVGMPNTSQGLLKKEKIYICTSHLSASLYNIFVRQFLGSFLDNTEVQQQQSLALEHLELNIPS